MSKHHICNANIELDFLYIYIQTGSRNTRRVSSLFMGNDSNAVNSMGVGREILQEGSAHRYESETLLKPTPSYDFALMQYAKAEVFDAL